MDQTDLDFAHVIKVKLRLNWGKRSRATEASAVDNEQSKPTDNFRISIAHRVMQRHPGLTQEKVLAMMEESGF